MDCKFIDCPGSIDLLLEKNKSKVVVVPGAIGEGVGITDGKVYKLPIRGEVDEKLTPRKFRGSLYMSYLDDLINFIMDNPKTNIVIPKIGYDKEKKFDIFDKVVREKLWDDLSGLTHVTLAWG